MDRMGISFHAHIRANKDNTVEYRTYNNGEKTYNVLEINGLAIFGIDIIKDKLIEELTN